jgi:hypothetical protein
MKHETIYTADFKMTVAEKIYTFKHFTRIGMLQLTSHLFLCLSDLTH